ncbi:hypothetical protein ILUMI_05280 [Ignelater luminosus]|uniref:Uncharacterized protein n=1 Tax=Ignelater luminosus TaxID=2038154 RepID=A0A8K0D7C2_IGNLU|nr:hypothetical protein ILUMI_05280 [Ignelater luminosus]
MSYDSDKSLFASDEECNINKTVNEYIEENVIFETPQKNKAKNIFKGKKLKSHNCNVTTNTIEHKLSELCIIRNYIESLNINSYSSNDLNSKYKSPYIFFELKEILNFTENCQPVNTNIKVFGIYKQNYLLEHKQSCTQIIPSKLLIDCRLLGSVPAVDQTVEMYGYVTYYKNDTEYCPIFIVKFWININSDFNKYINCLRRQRSYVPFCYKKITKRNLTTSGTNKNDYSFEEIDENCLNRNIDQLEQIYNDINEIMNISDDVFM